MGVAATGCVAGFLWLSASSNLISQVVVLWYLWAPLGAAAAALAAGSDVGEVDRP
jgi:hypothetical protein